MIENIFLNVSFTDEWIARRGAHHVKSKINKVSKMDSYECRLPQPGECFAAREQLIKCGSLGLLLRQEPGAGDELIT
jgi:hypothetical protein